MRILLGAAVVLVLLALMPFLSGGKNAMDSSTDGSSGWGPDVPAPDAPLATPWTGLSREGSGPGFAQPGTAASLDWNGTSQSPQWARSPETSGRLEPSAALPPAERQPWQASARPNGSPNLADGLAPSAVSNPPQAGVWNAPVQAAGGIVQPPHFPEDTQRQTSSWADPVYPSTSAYPPVQEAQPEITSWRDTGRWPYSSGEPRQVSPLTVASGTASATTNMPMPVDRTTSPTRGYYGDGLRPQANMNRSTAVGAPTPAENSRRYGSVYGQASGSTAYRPAPDHYAPAAPPQYRYGSRVEYPAGDRQTTYRRFEVPTTVPLASPSPTRDYGATAAAGSEEPGAARFSRGH